MLNSPRGWLRQRRTRTNLAIGAGILGIGYVTGQYVVSKIGEARDRMITERAAKENLRRRFKQNQEDCTITVIELLPTLTEHVLKALPCESITDELRQKRTDRSWKTSDNSEKAPSEISIPAQSSTDEDVRSFASDSYVRTSQVTELSASLGESRQSKTKLQLWSELKISSITRAFTLIYSASLLTLLTRIQLNLLGRRNYIASLVSSTSLEAEQYGISLQDSDLTSHAAEGDFETNRQYLTFSWWLLHRGWQEIMSTVETAVLAVVGSLKPTEEVSVNQLSLLVIEIRKRIEGIDTEGRSAKSWLSCLLPSQDDELQVLADSGITNAPLNAGQDDVTAKAGSNAPQESYNTTCRASLRRLLDETADVIESPLFNSTLTRLLDATFSYLVDDKIRTEAYKLPPFEYSSFDSGKESVSGDRGLPSVKLATILAIASREAHRIGSGSPNGYVEALEKVPALEGFASVVYSSNFELPSDRISMQSSDAGSLQDNRSIDSRQSKDGSEVHSLVSKAAVVLDTVWSGFENVWSKVSG